GGVILEILDEGAGLRAFGEHVRLAFVVLLATWCHGSSVPGARTAGGRARLKRPIGHGTPCRKPLPRAAPERACGAGTPRAYGTGMNLSRRGPEMTTFDDREHAFEAKYAHDE